MLGERWMRIAYSYLYIRDFNKAKDAFLKAIQCQPDNPAYYFHASLTLLRNRDYTGAMDLAQCAVRLDADNELYTQHVRAVESAILTEQANACWARGEVRAAITLFEQAMATDPLNHEAEEGFMALNPERGHAPLHLPDEGG